jgi:hypothetical protein
MERRNSTSRHLHQKAERPAMISPGVFYWEILVAARVIKVLA